MTTAPRWTDWTFDPLITFAVLIAAWAYFIAFRRAKRVAPKPPGATHWMPYAAGLGVLWFVLASPLDEIGERYLLSAHMLQHVGIADLAPALIILGLRAPILPLGLPKAGLRLIAPGGTLGRFIGAVTRPWVVLPIWAIATWGWAYPPFYEAAVQNPTLHGIQHATLFYAGIGIWWLIVDPLPSDRRKPHAIRLGYLTFTRVVSAAVCLPLTWLSTSLYPLYASAPRAYGLSAVRDQQIAGAAMCLAEFLIFGIAVAIVFIDMLSRDERMARSQEALLATPRRAS